LVSLTAMLMEFEKEIGSAGWLANWLAQGMVVKKGFL
jgi:hypothetical protein